VLHPLPLIHGLFTGAVAQLPVAISVKGCTIVAPDFVSKNLAFFWLLVTMLDAHVQYWKMWKNPVSKRF